MSTFSKKNKLGLTLPSTAVDNSAESPTASLASVEKLQVSEKLDIRYTLSTPTQRTSIMVIISEPMAKTLLWCVQRISKSLWCIFFIKSPKSTKNDRKKRVMKGYTFVWVSTQFISTLRPHLVADLCCTVVEDFYLFRCENSHFSI